MIEFWQKVCRIVSKLLEEDTTRPADSCTDTSTQVHRTDGVFFKQLSWVYK